MNNKSERIVKEIVRRQDEIARPFYRDPLFNRSVFLAGCSAITYSLYVGLYKYLADKTVPVPYFGETRYSYAFSAMTSLDICICAFSLFILVPAGSNIVYNYYDSLYKQPATLSERIDRKEENRAGVMQLERELEVRSNMIMDDTVAEVMRVVNVLPNDLVRLACSYLNLGTLNVLIPSTKIEPKRLKQISAQMLTRTNQLEGEVGSCFRRMFE